MGFPQLLRLDQYFKSYAQKTEKFQFFVTQTPLGLSKLCSVFSQICYAPMLPITDIMLSKIEICSLCSIILHREKTEKKREREKKRRERERERERERDRLA
eukprot:Pompholyxophrys_punicea_v1_NODE_2182_length_445_cov_1.728205.p1 type:complete len:101 gc:universal NODE_2182_length_445_cov_1.728205:92-394(+)